MLGYTPIMASAEPTQPMSTPEDHAVGLELELIELVERRERALIQQRKGDAERIQAEIDRTQEELAGTAERIRRTG